MEEITNGKMNKYLHDEIEKAIFISKGIGSMDPLKLAFSFPHPAIREFIVIVGSNKEYMLSTIRKLESGSDIEPKEYLRIMHFLYEIFDATDEAYDVFLKIANDLKED